jgi:ATP-dependent helicase/nuclease subunit A
MTWVLQNLFGENENVIRIMSVHKSKGLEFPIVFLSGAGKQFNMQDLNEQILLDQDMGFGPKYINFERKIEYNTIAKEAIKIKSKTELLSEEMRLLYVALTRAKEKIIITGVEKDLQKALENKQKELDMYGGAQKIPLNLVKKSKTYLDWLEYVYLFNKEKNIIEFNKIVLENEKTKEENDNKKEKKIDVIKDISKEQKEEVNKKLTWKYKYIESTKIEGKTSVSAIAKYGEKNIQIVEKPKFMQNIEILNKAEIGTLMHLILQKLDFRENYNEKTLNDLIQKLIYLNIVTEKQSQYIDKKRLLEFTKTELFKEIQNAKEIYKEQPFHMSVIDENTKESILIQGIIDLYYINQNNEIVLVDYKTEYVEKNNEQELIEKYKPQLKIYKKAIEEALNKNVEKVYIYSVYLNKEILVK